MVVLFHLSIALAAAQHVAGPSGCSSNLATAPVIAPGLTDAASAASPEPREGLEYSEFRCEVAGQRLRFRMLDFEPAHSPLELRAVRNLTSHPDRSCPAGYGGGDVFDTLRAVPGFEAVAATNGNFFSWTGEAGRTNALSNGFLWTRSSTGSERLAPFRAGRSAGSSLFVADRAGGHTLRIRIEGCRAPQVGSCVTLLPRAPGFTDRMPEAEFERALAAAYPTMTLATQLNMPLTQGYADSSGNPVRRECGAGTGAASERECRGPGHQPPARTVLCATSDGKVKLLTTPAALISELAVGLRPGGSCGLGCTQLFNLDGGGSTQLEVARAGQARLEPPSGRARPRCGFHRPVDHYLVFGRPQ